MSLTKNQLFTDLLANFLKISEDIESVLISDREGLIIAGEKKEDVDMELVSVLTTIINPILERIRQEFAFKKFGMASFDTDEYRLLFLSVSEEITLSLVLSNIASVDKLSPYAFFVAEKTAQILSADEDSVINITIPNLDLEAEEAERVKNMIYQMRLDSGREFRFKLIIVGDESVGKTSLVRQFVEGRFSHDYRSTLGVNMLTHSIELFENLFKFFIWDLGAQKFFTRFRRTYYKGTQAVFIVFDLTNRESFENLKKWYNELFDFIGKKNLPVLIIGNKSDLTDQRQVDHNEGPKVVSELYNKDKLTLSYIETSALTGENVVDAFNIIAYHFMMLSREVEENALKKDLSNIIKIILEKNSKLTISFVVKNSYWSPGFQVLAEIREYGEPEKVKDSEDEKIYNYANGLVLKNFTYDHFNGTDSDGVFCIFDARRKDHIDPKWKEYVVEMIEEIQENKVILIGIRISEKTDWSQMLEEFNINEYLEKKMVSVLFFKLGFEFRFEIYDQLNVMLDSIKNLSFL